MKKIYLYLAMLAGVAVACDKAETDIPQDSQGRAPEVKMITETISGSYGSTTRATISNDDAPAFAWSLGDNIAVHVSNGTTGQYVFTSDTGASGADAAATSAKFLVVYPEGYSRDAFAVFPSSIVSECTTAETNYGQSGNKLDVKLPGSYTLAQVTGTTTPCPMIATNTEGSNWSFYQLCGLLRLTVNCIPPSTKRLEIDFDGKKVWGDFSIAADVTPDTSVLATSADDGHDVITITKDGTDVTLNNNAWLDELVLNIPLPTGTYTNVTITSYNALTGGDATITITQPFAYTASREYATKRTFNVPVISISGSKRVVFSPGNLIKTDNTYTVGNSNASYEFEATPFNTNGGSLGYNQGAPTTTSARGYFTWNEACSLGSLTINGVAGWRVLTLGEWSYIMGRSMKYGIAKWFLVKSTGDKYGLLIPPDCATTTDVAGLNSGTVVNSNVDIDAYLAKGFVFLPAEGCWYGSASSWLWTNDEGYYWSTTQMNTTDGYLWCFDIISSVITNSYNNFKKAYYTSVRLIREVN